MNNQKMRDHIEIVRTINLLFTSEFCLTLWMGVLMICNSMDAGGLIVAVSMLAAYASLFLAHNMIAGYADMLEATLITTETNMQILELLKGRSEAAEESSKASE